MRIIISKPIQNFPTQIFFIEIEINYVIGHYLSSIIALKFKKCWFSYRGERWLILIILAHTNIQNLAPLILVIFFSEARQWKKKSFTIAKVHSN